MRKIGIMGGTFDPPHTGHLIIAEYVANEIGLETVLFVPTGKISYKKDMGTSSADRFHMTELAVEDNPVFDICDVEIARDGYTYTADTLKILHNEFEDAHFYFIVGADSLDYMDNWKMPEKVFSLCTVVAVGRQGYSVRDCEEKIRQLENKFNADIRLVDMPIIELSSSDIRERIKSGKSAKYMVPDCVISYIEQNKLYIGE